MEETESDILTPEEAAKHLKVSLQTLRKLNIPRLHVKNIIRYKVSDLDEWFDRTKTGGICVEANG